MNLGVSTTAALPLSCRLCAAPLSRTFVDLGVSPPCQNRVLPSQLEQPEIMFPLHVRICTECLLVQLPEYVSRESIFSSDYAYFSSYSDSWVEHARLYAEDMVGELGLDHGSLVAEVASNDGYLLQHFVLKGVPVLGIEPAGGVAEAAKGRGIRTRQVFLTEASGHEIRSEFGPADLVIANNVLAHVPQLPDFVRGLRALVADHGLITIEFPHLLKLINLRQYDTIYHEHYSYFSLLTAERALAAGGLTVVDVEKLSTHGGSLRLHCRPHVANVAPTRAVSEVLGEEAEAGLHTVEGHIGFAGVVTSVKRDLLDFLIRASRQGATVVGYGAPGKGNTLLNHAGVRSDLLRYTVDRSPHKQGTFLPGTRIPVFAPDRLVQDRPDYVLVLPWNLRDEIVDQLSYVRAWGGRLVFPIPSLEIL